MFRHTLIALSAVVLAAAPGAQAPQTFRPAHLVRGDPPGLPSPLVAGGGDVMVEAIVGKRGVLTRPVLVRSTPPFSQLVLDAIARWQFVAASITAESGVAEPVESTILVTALYQPPTLSGPTLGEAPKELAAVSRDAPYPTSIDRASYPPRALGGGVVMFEVSIDERGTLTNARTIHADPGFENASRAALLHWKFRGASIEGRPAASTAYVIFGFRQPVVASPR